MVKTKHWLAVAIALVFTVSFYRTAWVTEDAFITFRVVDNTLNGLGLVWNSSERVQVFTHPLWFGLLLPITAALNTPYFSVLLLSYSFLLITLAITWHSLRDKHWTSFAAILSLLWSKSFIDYSSSGLENPLTHVLIAAFFWAWLYKRQTLTLTLISSALFLSRPDAIVLIAPAVAINLWLTRQWKAAVLGMMPVILWTIFSLSYYGSPVPNTALAKVGTGLSASDTAVQAIHYFNWSYENDPITLLILAIGLFCGLTNKSCRPLAIGLLLFIFYLFYVGADYMGGRFLSAPVLLAALLVTTTASKRNMTALTLLLFCSTLFLNASPITPTDYVHEEIKYGIADERGIYHQWLGLSPVIRNGSWKRHPWFLEGLSPPGVYTRCTVGMAGYAGGPEVRWIDPLALTEPFLARLPSRSGARTGHYERALPNGYLESVLTGKNLIADPALHALYADVALATQAPLLTPPRIAAIWRLNTGFHRHATTAFDRNAIGLPGIAVQTMSPYSCYGIPYGPRQMWEITGIPATAHPR